MATTVFGATPGSDASDTHATPTPTGLNHYRSQTGLNDHSMKLFPTVTDLATWTGTDNAGNGLSANAQAMLTNNGGTAILFIIPLGGTPPTAAKLQAFFRSLKPTQKVCFCWESEADGKMAANTFISGIQTLSANLNTALAYMQTHAVTGVSSPATWYTRATFPITTSALMQHYCDVGQCGGAGAGADQSFIPAFGDTDYYGTDFYHHGPADVGYSTMSVSGDQRYQNWLAAVRGKLGANFANAKFAFPEYGVDSAKYTDAQRASVLQNDYDYVQGLGQGLYLWNYWYQIGNSGQGWPFALPSAMAVKWANLQGGGGGGGSAPVVTVTQPASGASIAAGADVLAKATVTDADSDLSTVTVKLDAQAAVTATLVSGSYQHDYGTALATGNHTITYTATDAAGHVTTGSVTFSVASAGSPPAVTITQPTAGQQITFGGDVLAKATVTDADGDLATVTVKLDTGAAIAATLVSGSYQHDYGTALTVGTHTLVYTATDAAGNVTTKTVTFSVVSAGSPPVVSITQPTSGQVFTQGDDVLTKASVTDADGDLSTVTVKLDTGSYVATSLVSGAYQHDYGTSLVVGSHSITFKATDAAGNITTTAVAFTVQAPAGNPIVTVQTPVDGSSLSDAGPVVASVTAAGQGGATITGVTSKLDAGSLIAMTLSGGVWSHTYAGPFSDTSHTVTFVATDSNGATTTVSTSFTAVSSSWNPTYDLRGNLPLGTLSRAATMQVRTSWSSTDGGAEAARVAKEVVFISGQLGASAGTGLPYKAQAVAADPTVLWANYEKNWAFPVASDSGGTKFPAKWYAKYRGGGKVQQSGTFVNWLMETGMNTESRASTTVDGVTETAYAAWHLKQILAQYATLHALIPQMRFAVWYDTAGTFCADNAPHFWQFYDATTAPSGDPGWSPHLARPYGQTPVVNGLYTDKTDLLAMLWWVGDLSRNGVGAPWAAINTGLYMVCANGAAPSGANAKQSDIAGHYDMVMAEGWTHQFGTWVAGTTQASAEGVLQTAVDVQVVHGSVFQVLDWAQAGYTAAQFTQFRRVSAAAALIAERTGGGVLWEFADVKSDNPAVETAKDPDLYTLQLGAPLHEPSSVAGIYPLGHRVAVGTGAGQASAVGLLIQQFAGGTVVWNYTATAKTYHAERALTRVADQQDTSTPSYAAGAAVVINPQSATLFTTSVAPPVAPSNTAAPAVTPSGSSVVGTVLATTDGSWIGTLPMTPDYQWQLSADGITGWANVAGATNPTFSTTGHATMYARCGVRETNAAGSSSRVVSNVVGPFTAATSAPGWASGSGPTITGSAAEGGTLTVVVGTTIGAPPPTPTYQWQTSPTSLSGSWTNIAGATASTLILPTGSAGSYRRCNVTLTNGVPPSAVKPTPSVGPITTGAVAPHMAGSPVITVPGGGAPVVGSPVSASVTLNAGTPPFTYTYSWELCDATGSGGVPITGANSQTYIPTLADVGGTLRVFMTVTNSAGSVGGLSFATSVVTGPSTFAPVNQTPPVVSPTGPVPAGTQLTTTDGTWAGTLPMTADYQWQYSLDGVTAWANIGGATNPFRWTTGDAGRYLRCGVRMTNSVGASSRVYSNVAGPVTSPSSPPSFAQPPTISGQAVEGDTLTVDAVQSIGQPPPTTTYQWQSSPDNAAWTNIGGATASTLVLPGGSAGTYRRCMVTLSNGNLPNAVAATNSLGPIVAAATAPHLTQLPTIVLQGGVTVPTVGVALTAAVSGVTGTQPITDTWEWQSYASSSGATGLVVGSSQSYTPTVADAGRVLRVTVTATNSVGSDTGQSAASAPVVTPVALPKNTTLPSVTPSGASPVGTILATTDGSWTGSLPMTPDYTWGVSASSGGPFTQVSGATGKTFDTTGHLNQYARSGVRMTNSAGASTRVFSLPVGPFTAIQAPPVFLDTAVVNGEAVEGMTLTVNPGRVSGLPAPTLTYQWLRAGAAIGGATNSSYLLVLADVGAVISCTVTASNGVAPNATETAPYVGPVTAAATGPHMGIPVLIWPGSDPQEGVPLTIEVPDVTGTPPLTYSWSWKRCDAFGSNCQVIAGATGQSYAPSGADVGHTLRGSVAISNSVATTGGMTPASPVVIAAPPPPPGPPPSDNGLGCGLYDVMIHSRGGDTIRHQLSAWTSVKWSRHAGAAGTGEVDLSGLSVSDFARCCAALSDVLPWADELALYRRRGNEIVGTLVWCGPIGDVQLNEGKAVIPAQDDLAWFDVRFVHSDKTWADTDLSEIALSIMTDALAPDTSPSIVVEAGGTGLLGSMAILASEYASAGEKLRSLVEQGLRLYCVRRTVTATGYPEPELVFTDSMFAAPPQVTLVGSVQATRVAITGQNPDTTNPSDTTAADGSSVDIPPPAATSQADADVLTVYGLIERAAQTDATTIDAVQGNADRWLGSVEHPVARIDSGILTESAPVLIDDLVPGRRVRVRLTQQCYQVDGLYELSAVDVEAAAGSERVTVHFTPVDGGLV